MKNKKLPILIGDIIVLSTVLALVFIIVYSYLTRQDNHYVYFILDDISFNLIELFVMILIPLFVSVIVYFKSRNKYQSDTTNCTYDIVLYLCSVASICLLSIINSIYVFLNTYLNDDADVFVLKILPDNEFMLFYIIVPLSVLIIVMSILLKIILNKSNEKSNSYQFGICIIFNIVNIIVCFFFSNILLVAVIIVTLFYGLINNKL